MKFFNNKSENEEEINRILGDTEISEDVRDILEDFNLLNNFEIVEDIYLNVKRECIKGYIPANEALNILRERIKFALEDYENFKIELMKKDADVYGINAYELASPPKLDLLNSQIELLRKDLRRNNELQEEILKILREK